MSKLKVKNQRRVNLDLGPADSGQWIPTNLNAPPHSRPATHTPISPSLNVAKQYYL